MRKIIAIISVAMLLAVCFSTTKASEIEQDDQYVYLPILMYHQISNDKTRLGEFVISQQEFENDLKLIQKYGYTTITAKDLVQYSKGKKDLPEKPIMLTFDDGFESDYVYAFPLLKKYNMKAVFSIIGKYSDLFSGDVHKHINYSHLSWDQVKEMHESGLAEFHNHTYDMHLLEERKGALKKDSESVEQYYETLHRDLERLNQTLSTIVGEKPEVFTCPFGFYNNHLTQAIKDAGFSVMMVTKQNINKLTGDPDELYHLNRFIREHNKDLESLILSWEEIMKTAKTPKNQNELS